MKVGDIVTNGKLFRQVLSVPGWDEELGYNKTRYVLSGAFKTPKDAMSMQTEYRNRFEFEPDEPIFKNYRVI